jgi:hypothetical protein
MPDVPENQTPRGRFIRMSPEEWDDRRAWIFVPSEWQLEGLKELQREINAEIAMVAEGVPPDRRTLMVHPGSRKIMRDRPHVPG